MVNAKMMDQKLFARLVRDLNVLGESIRTLQEQKQAVLDSFETEKKRYKTGHISEDTLSASVKKTNNELMRIDKKIRETIDKTKKLCPRIIDSVNRQRPKPIRVRVAGAYLLGSKKSGKSKAKKSKAKKSAKKVPKITPAEVKKEMSAEKKLIK